MHTALPSLHYGVGVEDRMCVVWEKGVVSERSTEFGGPKNVNFFANFTVPHFYSNYMKQKNFLTYGYHL